MSKRALKLRSTKKIILQSIIINLKLILSGIVCRVGKLWDHVVFDYYCLILKCLIRDRREKINLPRSPTILVPYSTLQQKQKCLQF